MTNVDSVMGYLAADHDRLDELLIETCRLVDAGDLAAAGKTFATFAAGLTRHIGLEDELLFPRFERATGMTSGPTTVMRREHRVIEDLLAGMTGALGAGDAATFGTLHRELIDVLEPHNHKEEHVIYPMTDEALDDDARVRLVAQLRAFT